MMVVCSVLFASRVARAGEGPVAVGIEFLFKIRVAAHDTTAAQRADQVHEHLTESLAIHPHKRSDITTLSVGKEVKIMVKKRLPVLVTPEDGKANHLSAAQQSTIWAKQVRNVLPKVSVKPNPNDQKGN